MDNLATAIVDSVHLFGQVLGHFSNGNANIPANTAMSAGNSMSAIVDIFSNLVSFLAQLTAAIATQL